MINNIFKFKENNLKNLKFLLVKIQMFHKKVLFKSQNFFNEISLLKNNIIYLKLIIFIVLF